MNKSEWSHGPWTNEHDFEWGTCGNYTYVIGRMAVGSLAGYISVPLEKSDKIDDLEVHGSITYESPEPCVIIRFYFKEPILDHFWIGFDAAHFCDETPLLATYRDQGFFKGMNLGLPEELREMADKIVKDISETYKDFSYMQNEVKRVVKQLDNLQTEPELDVIEIYTVIEDKK